MDDNKRVYIRQLTLLPSNWSCCSSPWYHEWNYQIKKLCYLGQDLWTKIMNIKKLYNQVREDIRTFSDRFCLKFWDELLLSLDNLSLLLSLFLFFLCIFNRFTLFWIVSTILYITFNNAAMYIVLVSSFLIKMHNISHFS